MVQVTECRILLPLTVEEFKRGQPYSFWKTAELLEKRGDNNLTLVSTSPCYHDDFGAGTFTHCLYTIGDRLPSWVKKLIPPKALLLHEKSWMTYPYIRTELRIPYFEGLKVEIFSMHHSDNGKAENALGLPYSDLAIRKVNYLDIGAGQVSSKDYQKELDPRLFQSKVTGRGPLLPGWQDSTEPLMCAYKVIKAEVDYYGMSTALETLITSMLSQAFLLSHKNCFCMVDEWHGMSYDDVWKISCQKLSASSP